MQRVNENTYIDDTLVTCTEYQLFIDEMLEQGKHFQPDHWTSTRFPRGQARAPVLGVRHADAVAFCEWVTRRRNDEWKFRLPDKSEATKNQMGHTGGIVLGHWLNRQFEFAWVGTLPRNVRQISIRQIEFSLDHDIDVANSHTFSNSFSSERTHAFDFLNDRHLSMNRAIELNSLRSLVLVLPRIIDINDISIAHDLNRVFNISCNNPLDITRTLGILSNDFTQLQGSLLELYIDIVTILERMVNHAPALEGIRLVKERIE